jgi:hypothetical protein
MSDAQKARDKSRLEIETIWVADVRGVVTHNYKAWLVLSLDRRETCRQAFTDNIFFDKPLAGVGSFREFLRYNSYLRKTITEFTRAR